MRNCATCRRWTGTAIPNTFCSWVEIDTQVDICNAFGFTIPDGCAPVYVPKAKPVSRKRGRPANPKVENQEL